MPAIVIAGVLVVVVVVVIAVLSFTSGSEGGTASPTVAASNGGTASSTATASNGGTVPPTVTASPTSAVPSMTFDTMREFVIGYFADLPARPYAAWAKRTPLAQSQTQESAFDDFWASMTSVTVVSVTPRDASSVNARLQYVRLDGTSKTDDAWIQMVMLNGSMMLNESGKL